MSGRADSAEKKRGLGLRARLGVGLALALALQVPLFWSFAEAATGSGAYGCEDLEGPRRAEISPRRLESLVARCAPPVKPRLRGVLKPIEPPAPVNSQLVDVTNQDEAKPTPVETRHLAEKTTRTEKETKAAPAAAESERRERSEPATSPKANKQPETKKTESETKDEKATDEVMPRVSDAGKRPVAKSDATSEAVEDTQGILRPGRGAKDFLKNHKALGDGTSDHLPDVAEGDRTVLNANSYRFADFFLQVKRAVERQWRPSEVYLQRDPTGQVYGVKDRYTVLRVTLDGAGRLVDVTTSRQSGLDFMDAEAKRSFGAAAPFLNPPVGLAGPDGMIRFEFGFFFEISNGRGRFDWRRL
jgi:hypothetical protein